MTFKTKKQLAYLLGGLLAGILLVILVNQPTKAETYQKDFETAEQEFNYLNSLYIEKQAETDKVKADVDSKQRELDALRAVLDALDIEMDTDLTSGALGAVIASYDSPLNAEEYLEACEKYPAEMCKIFVGIMVHESKLCTRFYLPATEPEYFNCSGWKSAEILATHTSDANGSWLQKFESYRDYFETVLPKFYAFYWQQNLRSAENIVHKYVGKYSQNWVNTVNNTITKL